jgi:hypothetical protein
MVDFLQSDGFPATEELFLPGAILKKQLDARAFRQ